MGCIADAKKAITGTYIASILAYESALARKSEEERITKHLTGLPSPLLRKKQKWYSMISLLFIARKHSSFSSTTWSLRLRTLLFPMARVSQRK